jgi:hypothetical protein
MKYWHKLPQNKIDKIIEDGTTIKQVLEEYKQPDWCSYPDALGGMMGCWSLTDNGPNGLRTKISPEFCKNCDCYINKNE